MTTEAAKATLFNQIERHGFSTVLCVLLLGCIGWYGNQIVEDNRAKNAVLLKLTESTTKALTENSEAGRRLTAQLDKVEETQEGVTSAIEKLVARIDARQD